MIPFLSLLIISSFYYFQLNNLLYNASIDFVEGYVVYNGLKLIGGENIYSHPTYIVPYPPLGYIFSAIGSSITPACMICGCRLVAFIFSILLAYLIFLEAGGVKWQTILAPAILCLTPILSFWSSLCRVDIEAAFFSILAAALYLRGRENLSAIAASIALQFKQTAISVILAIAIHAYFKRGTRGFIKILCKLVLASAIPYLILAAFMGPRSLLDIFYYSAAHTLSKTNPFYIYLSSVTGVSAVFYLISLFMASRMFKEDLYAPYYLISTILGFIMSTKVGANTNYFLEPLAVGSIMFVRNLPKLRMKWIYPIAAILLSYGLAVNAFTVPIYSSDSRAVVGTLCAAKIVSNSTKPVIVDDAYVAVLAGKELLVEPFIHKQLVLKGHLKDFLTRDLMKFRYDYVVLRWSCELRFFDSFCSFLRSNYTVIYDLGQRVYSARINATQTCKEIPQLEIFRLNTFRYSIYMARFLRIFGLTFMFMCIVIYVVGGRFENGHSDSNQELNPSNTRLNPSAIKARSNNHHILGKLLWRALEESAGSRRSNGQGSYGEVGGDNRGREQI